MYHQRLQIYFSQIFTTIVNKAFGIDSQNNNNNNNNNNNPLLINDGQFSCKP